MARCRARSSRQLLRLLTAAFWLANSSMTWFLNTGSTKTGIDVAEGATSHLARVTLELGGKSAQIVFPDADLEAAAIELLQAFLAAHQVDRRALLRRRP